MKESKEIKMLQAMVDITNYLAKHKFTYPEAEEFARNLQSEISCSKDAEEYKTADDWYHKKSCCNIQEKILVPLNKVNVKELFGLIYHSAHFVDMFFLFYYLYFNPIMKGFFMEKIKSLLYIILGSFLGYCVWFTIAVKLVII